MQVIPTGLTRLRLVSPLPLDTLVAALGSGLSTPTTPRVLPGSRGPFLVTGEVLITSAGANVCLHVPPTTSLRLPPTLTATLHPAPAGSVLEVTISEHSLALRYLRATWLLLLLPLSSVVLGTVAGGAGGALRSLLLAVLAAPAILLLQHVWLLFVRRLYATQHAQLREYVRTCCQGDLREI